jgi:hypothetical protein
MSRPKDDTPEPERETTPKRSGKKGTWRSLSAAEYAEETGASLYVRPSVSTNPSPTVKPPRKPAQDDDKGEAPPDA